MNMSNLLVIGDADAIIALANLDDPSYKRASAINLSLRKAGVEPIFPVTAYVEAVTVLQRKLGRPDLVKAVIEEGQNGGIIINMIDESIMLSANGFFNPYGSKKNTLFDAIVAAVAKKYEADAIFSFDQWYTKAGFKLAEELV